MEPIKIIALAVSSFAVGFNLGSLLRGWHDWRLFHKGNNADH